MNSDKIHINTVLSTIYGHGRGYVFTAKDLSNKAEQSTIRKILERLAKAGTIRRIRHGVYDYPPYSKLLHEPSPPRADAIADAIARAHGWKLVPTGATALNTLGLSTQVPAQWKYYSDGPSKEYSWKGGKIIFTRRANRELSNLSPKTAILVQAVKTFGKNGIDEKTLSLLRQKTNNKDLKKALREARYVPAWIYENIKRMTEGGDNA